MVLAMMGSEPRQLLLEAVAPIAGVAVIVSHASDKYRYLHNAESSQTAVEATCRAQINPWFALQPTLQYIASPNMDAALGNACVVGARLEMASSNAFLKMQEEGQRY